MSSISCRGEIIRAAVACIITSLLLLLCLQPARADQPDVRSVCTTTNRITWGDVDVLPRNRGLVTSILGRLYSIGYDGRSKLLRDAESWDTRPRVSPDGRRIAFLSDADGGARNIWVMPISGGLARQISFEPVDIGVFDWGANGGLIAAPIGRYQQETGRSIVAFYPDGREPKLVFRNKKVVTDIDFSQRDQFLYFTEITEGRRDAGMSAIVKKIDRKGNVSTDQLGEHGSTFAPQLSPDGKLLAFGALDDGVTSLWIEDRVTGTTRQLLPKITSSQLASHISNLPLGTIPAYRFLPDGNTILITVGGLPTRVDIGSGSSRSIKFEIDICRLVRRPKVESTSLPAVRRILQLSSISATGDTSQIVFEGGGKIWSKSSGSAEEITLQPGRQSERPIISPDGNNLAYIARLEGGQSELRIRSLKTGSDYIAATAKSILNVAWSPDGNAIAYATPESNVCAKSNFDDTARRYGCRIYPVLTDFKIYEFSITSRKMRSIYHDAVPSFLDKWRPPFRYEAGGSKLLIPAFSFDAGEEENPVLLEAELHSGQIRRILNIAPELKSQSAFIFSPDGLKIALSSKDALWVIDRAWAEKRRFVNLETSAKKIGGIGFGAPYWTDRGELLWFSGDRLLKWNATISVGQEIGRADALLPVPIPARSLAIMGARMISMAGDEVIENGTILIEKGRIKAIGAAAEVSIPADVPTFDASGMTIIPGIVDTHGHPHFSTKLKGPEGQILHENVEYLASLAWGVTTLFDPQGPEGIAFAQGEMQASGVMVGPRILSTGEAIFGRLSGNQPSWGQNTADIREIVDRKADLGASMIKSYIVDRRDWRREIVESAARRGIGVTLEGGDSFVQQLTYVQDGHLGIEHNLMTAPLYEDVISYVCQSGIYYTPTLVASTIAPRGKSFFYGRGDYLTRPKYLQFAENLRKSDGASVPYIPDRNQAEFESGRSARELLKCGTKIAIGSHGEQSGLSAHWDIWLLQLSGFTPYEALQAATIRGAEKLSLDNEIGSLEVGKLADMIILGGNPLDDIRQTANIQYVVQGGFVYDGDTLDLVFPSKKPVPRPSQIPEDVWKRARSELRTKPFIK
jgi:imidazolonepropionase-like amidohydrolase/Tol biopolymer transport system component